ncbi:glycosyltransferase [Methylosinus sporium]|uniref:Glycosyltransferase n=1 Tax=Methylosinus sporium TaxID=428 RepID=A0A549T4H0_METSR|nr:glycosyltransferase family 2 protein [Methylosinus sporium]TRL36722.1 glycosyltransferase [Methylosinus sporium]
MNEPRIFIPTRDSGKWISEFLDAYRRAGVEPLYVVDDRSCDRTLSILRDKGAEVVEFRPSADFAEAGMVEFGARRAGTRWVLRLDDDEFPSQALLHWMKDTANLAGYAAWSISRRELSWRNDALVYSQWPTRIDIADGVHFNGQLRLWEASGVSYIEKIHSCGIEPPSKFGRAPAGICFAHFNNLLRSLPERLEKVRRYAAWDQSLAWRLADESLPELTDSALHFFNSEGVEEFEALALRTRASDAFSDGCLTLEEQRLLAVESQRWMGEVIRAAQGTVARHRAEAAALRAAVPLLGPAIRVIAECYCTAGRLSGSTALQSRGAALWNLSRER